MSGEAERSGAAQVSPAADSRHLRLEAAVESGRTQPQNLPDAVAIACPLAQREALEVWVADELGEGLGSVAVELRRGEQVLRQLTDRRGHTRFEGLLAGTTVDISLWELDTDSWELMETLPLPVEDARSSGTAAWVAAAPLTRGGRSVKTVVGDCLASLGYKEGLLPEVLWNDPANAELRERRENLYVLAPADDVYIAAFRRKQFIGRTAQRYIVRRKGVPELLRVRFLNFCNDPRANVPYILLLQCASGRPLPPQKGLTDAQGFLVEPIPPDAWKGRILLGGPAPEEIKIGLGRINPISDPAGVEARLQNLGYRCGPTGKGSTALTAAALRAFQQECNLEANGEINSLTMEKLLEKYLC